MQQKISNTDQMREVEGRIQSLTGILTYPVGEHDGEEKARREVFRRFIPPFRKHRHVSNYINCHRKLVGIVVNLRPLAEQHGFMKFLKNVDHANILSGFVKELADAITDYQVCDPDFITGAV